MNDSWFFSWLVVQVSSLARPFARAAKDCNSTARTAELNAPELPPPKGENEPDALVAVHVLALKVAAKFLPS